MQVQAVQDIVSETKSPPLRRASLLSLVSYAMSGRAGSARRKNVLIDQHALESGAVLHFYDYLKCSSKVEYQICIPSFNRPERLCESTLRLLRRHGIAMNRVHVFVAPTRAPAQGRPEWSRYIRELRERGYGDVHVEPGGDGIVDQMHAIFSWAAEGTYIICLADDVDDIKCRKDGKASTSRCKPLPNSSLEALFSHAWDLMRAGNFSAWGLSPSKNVLHMDAKSLSRKLGLIEGNFWGIIAQPWLPALVTDPEVNVIYDVAFTTELWASGRRFFRYRGLCCISPYKLPGGLLTLKSKEQRRCEEDAQIQKLSMKHPSLVQFKRKEGATLSTMQYSFSALGAPPIRLRDPTPLTRGRRYEGHALRSMTPAERQRKCRRGHAAMVSTEQRLAKARYGRV